MGCDEASCQQDVGDRLEHIRTRHCAPETNGVVEHFNRSLRVRAPLPARDRAGGDPRHTYTALALLAGIHPNVVSKRLGHATVSITRDACSHAIPAIKKEAAARIAERVFVVTRVIGRLARPRVKSWELRRDSQ